MPGLFDNEADRQAAYRKTFTGDEVRRKVLADLIDRAGIFDSLLPQDGRSHEFKEGRRDMAMHILESMGLENILEITRALETVPVNEPGEKQKEGDNDIDGW